MSRLVKRLLVSGVGVVAVLAATVTLAGNPDKEKASTWLILCRSENPDVHRMCTAYLRGFTDGARLQSAMRGGNQSIFCFDKNTTGAELRRIIVRYLDDHPELLDEWFVTVAGLALVTHFPCSDEDKSDK